jgi:hypothetical protein
MKKVLLTTLLAVAGLGLFAQKLDKAKDLLKANKLSEAKTEIDNVLADAKNQKNGEAWYYKAKVYDAISADNALGSQTPDARWQAFEAIQKYTELDDKKLLLLTIDNYKPIMNIYQGYYKDGAALFNAGKFAEAYSDFKNCLTVSDFMTKKEWTNVKLDTTVVLYTGISAEKASKRDDAATYYSRLANAKVTGESMVEIYKWLVDYYARKKDGNSMQKYLTLGREIYPKDNFWNGYELDYLRGSGDTKALFAKYEEVLAKTPNDYETLYNYGVELYQSAYDTSDAKRPANSAELIGKVATNMKKVVELKPDFTNAYLVLGQIEYNKGVDINKQVKAIRPAPGKKLTPDELKKKNDLRTEVITHFDAAMPYFTKIDDILGGQGKLRPEEKKALKEAYDLMTTIYEQKGDKEKMKVYEDKFVNVEKVH